MLIYLDANIVQDTADYADFLFGTQADCPVEERVAQRELCALRELIDLEQFGSWTIANCDYLQVELHRGRPSNDQLQTYEMLNDCVNPECAFDERVFRDVLQDLLPLRLRDRADQWHLATAVAMGASWFLTNDHGILRKVSGLIRSTRVASPSECIEEISVGLFLR
jgi:hypothetical protein